MQQQNQISNVKHYTREEIEALHPKTTEETGSRSKTEITIDGIRYDRIETFIEVLEIDTFNSFWKGFFVGLIMCVLLTLMIR